MGWHKIQAYAIGWKSDTNKGVIEMKLEGADNGQLKIDGASELAAVADILRNESPTYFNEGSKAIRTGWEPALFFLLIFKVSVATSEKKSLIHLIKMPENHYYDFTFLVKNILATLTFLLLSSEKSRAEHQNKTKREVLALAPGLLLEPVK